MEHTHTEHMCFACLCNACGLPAYVLVCVLSNHLTRLGCVCVCVMLQDVLYSSDGSQVLSCSSDGTVRIWDAKTCEQLHGFR